MQRFFVSAPSKMLALACISVGVTASSFINLHAQEHEAIAPAMQATIEAIASNDRVDKAVRFVRDDEANMLKRLVELNEIPAPPFGEEKRAHRFAELLRNAGLEQVEIDEVGNVIGRRKGNGNGKVVALGAHLDTVFPVETDVTVKVENGRYTAPGIGDNTRGLVTLLAVLRAMQAAEIETNADILFIANVGEEGLGDLRGVKHLFREGGPGIDRWISIDGGSTNRLIYGGVGSIRYRVTFKGPGGHSWGAFGTGNTHHALGRGIAKFAQDAVEVTASGEKVSFNVGRIGGGTSINSVPFESWMEVDMRSGDVEKLAEMDAVFRNAMQTALSQENAWRTRGDALTVDVKRVGLRPAGLGDASSRIVQSAMASMAFLGIKPELTISSTDSNIPISMGVPAVTLSRGGKGGDAHALTEWWQDEDTHLAVQVAMFTLLEQAGLASR